MRCVRRKNLRTHLLAKVREDVSTDMAVSTRTQGWTFLVGWDRGWGSASVAVPKFRGAVLGNNKGRSGETDSETPRIGQVGATELEMAEGTCTHGVHW